MALEKARKGRENLASSSPRLVLGADTVVGVEGQVLGKPEDAKAAYHQLMQLSGRSHEVLSAVALVASPRTERLRLARSRVWFRPLDPAECNAYCATGEPLDKAGSYAIQGLAAAFIYRLEGSYSGVMGLPLFETAALLEEMGIPILPRAAERHRQE
jgi:septum formation protein